MQVWGICAHHGNLCYVETEFMIDLQVILPILSSPTSTELPGSYGSRHRVRIPPSKRPVGRGFLLRHLPIMETSRSADGVFFSHGAGAVATHSFRVSRAGKRSEKLLLSLGGQFGRRREGRLRNRGHHFSLSNGEGMIQRNRVLTHPLITKIAM